METISITRERMARKLKIPTNVLEYINVLTEMNIINLRDMEATWNATSLISDYIHKDLLWKAKREIPELTTISVEQIQNEKKVLMQKVFWTTYDGEFFYGTGNFVKSGNTWYFFGPCSEIRIGKFPKIKDFEIRFKDENGNIKKIDLEKIEDQTINFYFKF